MNVLALCAGYGGLELGLELATGGQARTVCYVEREAYAASILVARMESGDLAPAPVWSDLETFDAQPWRGVVDCVTAGFPCQPFSSAGKGLGLDDERWLWPAIAKIIEAVAPSVAFFENVPGLERHGLEVVWCDLRRLGYDVAAGTFTACEVGAPHIRKRLFILAHADDQPAFERSATGTEELARDCGDVPDADSVGLQARRRSATRVGAEAGHASAWVVGAGPPVSAVCRVDDGCSERLDRLRLLGNGVVPQQAAIAFRDLWGRLT